MVKGDMAGNIQRRTIYQVLAYPFLPPSIPLHLYYSFLYLQSVNSGTDAAAIAGDHHDVHARCGLEFSEHL
jgi:hypothetical protein